MLLDENAMKQFRLIQYMPDDSYLEKFKKDKALNEFFNMLNKIYLEYKKRPVEIQNPEQLITEIGKILLTDLSHMQKCLAIGLLLELGGETKKKMRVETVRKALGISNRGFHSKKALEEKDLFRLKYLSDEKITEVEYLGTNPQGNFPVEPDIRIEEPFFRRKRRYNV